jgi:hypothetical protein
MAGHRFIHGVTDGLEIAIDASRFAGHAHSTAMPNKLMRKLDPLILGNYRHQILLDFLGFALSG